MLASKEELNRIQREIELLSAEVSDDAIDMKARKILSESAYREIASLQEELKVYFSSILLFLVSGLFKLDSIYCYWTEVGKRLRLLSASASAFWLPLSLFLKCHLCYCMTPLAKVQNISCLVLKSPHDLGMRLPPRRLGGDEVRLKDARLYLPPFSSFS